MSNLILAQQQTATTPIPASSSQHTVTSTASNQILTTMPATKPPSFRTVRHILQKQPGKRPHAKSRLELPQSGGGSNRPHSSSLKSLQIGPQQHSQQAKAISSIRSELKLSDFSQHQKEMTRQSGLSLPPRATVNVKREQSKQGVTPQSTKAGHKLKITNSSSALHIGEVNDGNRRSMPHPASFQQISSISAKNNGTVERKNAFTHFKVNSVTFQKQRFQTEITKFANQTSPSGQQQTNQKQQMSKTRTTYLPWKLNSGGMTSSNTRQTSSQKQRTGRRLNNQSSLSSSTLRLNLSKIGIGKNIAQSLASKAAFTERSTEIPLTTQEYASNPKNQQGVMPTTIRARELRNETLKSTACTATQPNFFRAPTSYRSQERLTEMPPSVAGPLSTKVFVSPALSKPNFAQVARHSNNESSVVSMQHETTQDDLREVQAAVLQQPLHTITKKYMKASKTPVMKKSATKHLTLLESCCLMPQHTRSSEQMDLRAGQLMASGSRKDLFLQKFRDSNTLAGNCRPRLEINDQSLILDPVDQQRWDLLTTSGSADVPDEDTEGKPGPPHKNGPNVVSTMTQQNKRSHIKNNKRDRHLMDLQQEPGAFNSGLGSKTGSISQSVLRNFSQVQDMQGGKSTRPSTHLGNKKMSCGEISSAVVSQKTKNLKITILSEVGGPNYFGTGMKNLIMFSTPKNVSSLAKKPLIKNKNMQYNKLFKKKPSIPSIASVGAFGDCDIYADSSTKKTQTGEQSSQPPTICSSDTTRPKTTQTAAASTKIGKKTKKQKTVGPTEMAPSPAQTSDKSPQRAYFSRESTQRHGKVFSHSDQKVKLADQEDTGSSHGGNTQDIFASYKTQSLCNFAGDQNNRLSQLGALKSTAEFSDCYDSQRKKNGDMLNKENAHDQSLTINVLENATLDLSNQDAATGNTHVGDGILNVQHKVSRQVMPPEVRAKTIDTFLERQQSLEKKRMESIESMREKIFVQQTTSKARMRSGGSNGHRQTLRSEASQKSQGQQSDNSRAEKKISFLKRMTKDTQARREFKERVSSANARITGSPATQQSQISPPLAPKNPQNTPQLHLRSSCEKRSVSGKSCLSLGRLMQPIGHFSSSFTKASIMVNPSQTIKRFNNGARSVESRCSSNQSGQVPNVVSILQLNDIKESFLSQVRQEDRPGKTQNDKIMLLKLEEQLKPLKKRAEQTINRLTRVDFYEMLFELEMLVGPEPTKRDKNDAEAFLDIFMPPPEETLIQDQETDVIDIQADNAEKFVVFSSLVKAILLHVTSEADQDLVQECVRKYLLKKVHSDVEYRDWLASKFFVFYLNRTRSYTGQGRAETAMEAHQALNLRQQQSLDSNYLASRSSYYNMHGDSRSSDILENKTFQVPHESTIQQKLQLPQRRSLHHRKNPPKAFHQLMFKRPESSGKPRTLRRQKQHVQSLIEFGVQRLQEREKQFQQKQEEEVKELEDHEAKKKERLARYPWIDEELAVRKSECCERLYYDALRRLGLPLPEFDREPTDLELLDQKFDVPSIYQAIQLGAHASLEEFQSSEAKLIEDQLASLLAKYKDLRVPKDERCGLESDDLSEDEFDLGYLPVLSIDLITDEVMAEEDKATLYPTLLLYEDDLVIERLQAYLEVHPMSAQTQMNLLEHIAFKLKHL